MEQMADETTLRADVKDKGRASGGEESSTWAREDRVQTEAQISDWRLGVSTEAEPGESSRDSKRPKDRESAASPLFSLKMYLRRASPSPSPSTDSSLSSSQQSSMGVDCAGMVLNCLFCRFYDFFHMLPDSCEKLAHHCCPSYTHILSNMESTPSDDDSCIDWDCGLFNSCQDTSDCLELAMEVSELCYH
ncbi:myoD family inhibitor domain-containing protein 2 [Salarias fasciatus]|uniref:myoD family inhibitor domain-containing protein 2 n=1 Tax=Salarias fasciatus TaxID=181472 RepID=UPI001176CA21|nr:myoD family inhibitor domain-containing protein 2 [Salarias fasciatus]